MVLSHLKINEFRNYHHQKFEFHNDVNAIVGKNGMGKTNILEAIYYLCFGKSYFTSSDKHVINLDSDFFRLSGNFLDNISREVVVKFKSGSKKELEVAGKKIDKIADHIGQFLCVIVAPDDIIHLLELSEERRNFINNTIVQTDKKYLDYLLTYTHLLKQRNALLKSFQEKKTFDKQLLEAISIGMYRPAEYIFQKRQEQISQIIPIFNDLYKGISAGNELCNISYQSQLQSHNFQQLMEDGIEKDRILGRSNFGIHKDDLIFKINDEPLKNYASQGQLKSFILALKLAQYKMIEISTGKKPLLLLDDIFDRLDSFRVSQLINVLKEYQFGQVFLTDTQEARIKAALEQNHYQFKILLIENGCCISK